MITVSASSLKAYIDCKYKVIMRKADIPRISSASLILGSYVHKGIENYLKGYDSAFKKAKDAMMVELTMTDDVRFYRGQSYQSLQDTADICFDNFLQLRRELPKTKEVEKEFDVPHTVWMGYLDSCAAVSSKITANLIGRMDLVGNGDIVVDFKSSKKGPTKLELAADLQASFYMYVYRKMYGVLPKYWLVYLRPGKIFRVDRADFSDFERTLEDYVWDSFYESLHRQSDGYKCSQCEYQKYCLGDQPGGEVIFETTQEPVVTTKRESEFFPY